MNAGSAPGRVADPVRTIFFGSGVFAVPILDALSAYPGVQLVAVVSAPDRPAGRAKALTSTPVTRRAHELGVVLLQPARVRAPEAVAEIAALGPELGVLADFGQIVPGALLDIPRLGMLGVHPSLLPRHRGATPIPATIAAGDSEAGATIYRMDTGMDTGPTLAATSWPLRGDETAPALEGDAARRSADLLATTIAGYLAGTIQPVPQPAATEAPTRPLRREEARLDPARSAVELERRVRAHLGWPGSFIETRDGRTIVLGGSVAPSQPSDAPGRLVRHDGRMALATADGRLVLDSLQPAGGRAMTGEEFLRGRPNLLGAEVVGPAPEDKAREDRE